MPLQLQRAMSAWADLQNDDALLATLRACQLQQLCFALRGPDRLPQLLHVLRTGGLGPGWQLDHLREDPVQGSCGIVAQP